MRIRKRLQINVAVSVLMALIVCLVVFLSLERLNKANNLARTAGEINVSVLERVTFRNDYMRNNSVRAKEQWFAKHAQIDGLLKSASETFQDAGDRENITASIENQKSIGNIFSTLVANRERTGTYSGSTGPSREVEDRLLSQLNMRVYEEALYGRILLESSREARASALRLAGVGITSVLLIIIATVLFNSWTMSRIITDRVLRLHEGSAIIGRGNLDHWIDVKGNDEFTELSEAFNEMTAKLRGSYHDLEDEIGERKRAEEALHVSEARLRRFYESGLLGVLYWNMDGAISGANDKFLEMVGYTRDDLTSDKIDWIKMTPLEYRHLDERSAAELKATGVNKEPFEKEYVRKDGTRVPVIVAGAMLDEARFDGVAFALDITDRKQAEQELKDARDELELRVRERTEAFRRQAELIELSREAIVVTDLEKKIIFWSSGAEETYGWTKTEAEGNNIHSFLKTRWPMPLDEQMAVLTREGRWEGELIHTRKDGSELTVLSRQVLQRDEAGMPVAIMEINIDITDRKRAEVALQASEERWATTLASIGDAVIATDTSGSIVFMNAVAEALTGWTFADALQKPITEVFRIINEETRLEVENPIVKVLREGMIVGLANHTLLVKKDGTEVPIDDSGAPIRDKEGKTSGVVLIFRDITERKQAEENLQREMDERKKAEDQLRQGQKMEAIGTLAGGIAHDFNNILAAILGFTEMVIDDVPDPDVQRNLNNVLKSAMRAKDLVKQILAFSRKTNYERTPLSLTPLVKETVQLLRASIPATVEIRLTNTASSDTVLASPVELQQILMNLATNASLAMQERGGTLEISLSDLDFGPDAPVLGTDVLPGEYLQLILKDTGVGMGPDVMKRVFEPFFTTREVGKGTGMGLAVVYGIVKDLRGTITVESEIGVGSTFRILLPKAKTELKEEQLQAVHIPGGKERILFTDDEEMLIEWGQATLERLGYTVATVTNGTEAMKVFSSNPSGFDLVITDHTMPGLTGVQLAKALLKIRSDIPIILCTGHSETVSPEIAKEAGIREYLMKPLAKQELAQAVRRVLDANKEE